MSYIPGNVNHQNIPQPRLRPVGERYLFSTTQYFFTLEELNRLKGLVDPNLMIAGEVALPEDGSIAQDPDMRRSRIQWLKPTENSSWLYNKIGDIIRFHNQTYYGYDLEGIENLQFSEYPEGEGYYKPHLDWGAGSNQAVCRKLSFTIQLSNPESYEGGDLNFCDGRDKTEEQRAKLREFGSIVVFPSWVLHEVTPVTKGTRRSLVGWCVGPDFR